MNIPIPCKFGERADCNNKQLPLIGVDWFNWSWGGLEYTYCPYCGKRIKVVE